MKMRNIGIHIAGALMAICLVGASTVGFAHPPIKTTKELRPAPSVSSIANYPQGADNGEQIWEDTGATNYLYAPITATTAGSPTSIVTGVAGKKIRVIGFLMTNITAGGTAAFQTSTGSANISGAMAMAANGSLFVGNQKGGIFETLTGDSLQLAVTGSSNTVSGYVVYVLH